MYTDKEDLTKTNLPPRAPLHLPLPSSIKKHKTRLTVREHLVGLCDLLEAPVCLLLIVRVLVRVPF